MRRRNDEGLDYRPRIGVEEGDRGKEAIWFAARAGESNASKVETWEAARSAATSLRSLGLRTANQFSGWASISPHSG